MAVPLSTVLGAARAYLNDTNATVWTDQVLIPLAQEAHRELQSELWLVGSPLVRGYMPSNVGQFKPFGNFPYSQNSLSQPLDILAFNVPVNLTNFSYCDAAVTLDTGDLADPTVITGTGATSLTVSPGAKFAHAQYAPISLTPFDLLVPTRLSYSSPQSTSPIIPMTETAFLPTYDDGVNSIAQYWTWQEENLILGTLFAERFLRMEYRRKIRVPLLVTDDIGVLFGEMYMSPRTAAIALGTVKEYDAAKVLSDVATTNFSKLVAANRGQQKPPSKP
jgi:hypothetical protein